MRKQDRHLGEEHSSENIKCKSPEVGMYLPVWNNEDAFVASMSE